MGIQIDDTQNGQEAVGQAQSEGFANQQAQQQSFQPKSNFGRAKVSLGFDSHGMSLMSGSKGSEYTKAIANGMAEAYKSVPNPPSQIKIDVLDNHDFTNLKYSAIVTSVDCGNEVCYHTVLLEATGDRVFTASDVMVAVADATKNYSQGNNLQYWSPDDANNVYLHNEIKMVLSKAYGNKPLKSVDSVVLPKEHGEIADVAEKLAATSYNACIVEWCLSTEAVSDLNIATALQKEGKGKILKISSDMRGLTGTNPFGSPFRADWKLVLNITDAQQTFRDLNVQSGNVPLVETAGFVDAIPEAIVVQQHPGYPPVEKTTLRPNIIITNNNPLKPTPCYMLLGIISSIVMTNPGMWIKALPLKDSKNQFGSLNVYTGLTKDKDGNATREILDLTNKQHTKDKVYNVAKTMYTLQPMISMDIPAAGHQTFYTAILSTAANPNNPNNIRTNAISELIAQANWLTNGAFPLDFPINEVFIDNGVVIPLGEWSDKTGLRDIRDIDLAFICGHSDSEDMMNKWVLTNFPSDKTGLDPFFTKVDIISKLVPDARITGKAVRVTFTGKFINTLAQAAAAAGLDARYEAEIKFLTDNNIGMVANYLTNAGVGNSIGFAREYTPQGVNFTTQYTNAGTGRFGGF